MIKRFAYMLKSLARLLYRRIIYYDTGVLVLRLNAILAKRHSKRTTVSFMRRRQFIASRIIIL